jgi:hypothetical protein
MDELENVTRARDAAAERLMRIPGVTGVGVGHKVVDGERTDTIAIVIYVSHKRDEPEEPIPPEIDGVPTDVQERTFVLHEADSRERETEPKRETEREGADGGRAGRGTQGQGRDEG